MFQKKGKNKLFLVGISIKEFIKDWGSLYGPTNLSFGPYKQQMAWCSLVFF